METLACIGIMALLASIVFALSSSAKRAGEDAVSASNLKQICLQTLLYQEDNGGGGSYGSIYAMNLPPWPSDDEIPALAMLRPPRYQVHKSANMGQLYRELFVQPELDKQRITWSNYSQRAQEKSILYVDPYVNDAGVPLRDNNYVTRRFLAVDISATLRRIVKKGDWETRAFWLP
jgi:hypothetical protein